MVMSVMPGDGVGVPNGLWFSAVRVDRSKMGTLRFVHPTGFHDMAGDGEMVFAWEPLVPHEPNAVGAA